jgi:hypothetical protein
MRTVNHRLRESHEGLRSMGPSTSHSCFIETRAGLIEWEPDNAARTVAAVAVSWLVEGTGQLPFLRFIAPLGYGVRYDIV